MEQQTTTYPHTQARHLTDTPDREEISLADVLAESFSRYARERPESLALWALGIGFALGWKLKPW